MATTRGQWIRCFFGFHNKKLETTEQVTNIRGDVVGNNYISICENCGAVHCKFIPNKLEEIRKY